MGSWKICVLLFLASATQSSAFYRKVGLGWFDNWLPEASSFDDSMESTDGFFTFDSPLVCPQNCTCEDIATVPPTTTTTTEVTESTTTSTPTETNSTTPAEPTNTTTLAELSTTTTADPSTAEPTTTTTADPSTAEPSTAEPTTTTTADPSTAEPTTTTTTSLAESFKNLKGATEPTAPTPAEPTATTPAEPTATTPAESTATTPAEPTTTGETTTTTAIPETTTAQVCSLTQKCVCFKPVADVETDGFDFEWHNFLYGGLAGVGAIVLLVVLYQLICFKEKKSKGAYEIGMSDYVSDDVA